MTTQKTLQARLHNAIRIGRPARVREVVESGADAREIDILGRTMLQVLVRPACDNQDDVIEIAQLLLKAGVDINAADSEGTTALTLAAYYIYTDVLQFLIQNGADANPRTPDGRTLINHLENDPIFRNRRRRIVKLLEQAGGVRQPGEPLDQRWWASAETACPTLSADRRSIAFPRGGAGVLC